jgi:hypothetical protein
MRLPRLGCKRHGHKPQKTMACGTFLLPPQLELEYNLDWQLTVLAYGRFLQQLRSTGNRAVLRRLWRGFSCAV